MLELDVNLVRIAILYGTLGFLFATGVVASKSTSTEPQAAAEAGDMDAQFNLAVEYMKREDPEVALKWFLAAADKGHAEAQLSLGLIYSYGIGVAENDAEAVKWYRKAAELGHAGAQFNLGVMYENGQGVVENYVDAVKWYRKAADQGDANAQFQLGVMYDYGQGVVENDVEAVNWYR
ncbi:MAG: sel1 repeat family protein, partial [Xanthomonadales bacterium]|nr:sel1 repeat family protein [Xanthomonadales bacterium]